MANNPAGTLKYWWSDDEEIIRSDAFDTREQAYSDAYCSRAQCFDDPSQSDGFYLHHGKMVDNPEYDADAAKHYGFDEDNAPQLLEGKTERVDALTVTDLFHDQWVLTRAHPEPTGDRMAALERAAKLAERLKKVANLHPDHSYTPLGAYKCSRDRGMIDPYGYLYEALSVIEALTAQDVQGEVIKQLQEYYLPQLKFNAKQHRDFAFEHSQNKEVSATHHGCANGFETSIGCIEEALALLGKGGNHGS